MTKIRVMCLDDSELVAESLGRRLKMEPDLEWAGWVDHPAALRDRLAADGAPHVLLVDVDMPGIDSFAILADLKRHQPQVRIAMLTGHVRREYYDKAVSAGADGYICKDDDPSQIIDHIRRLAAGEFVVSPDLGF